MSLCMCEGKFVDRNEVALVDTPPSTLTWKPVPHIEVIDAGRDVSLAHARHRHVHHRRNRTRRLYSGQIIEMEEARMKKGKFLMELILWYTGIPESIDPTFANGNFRPICFYQSKYLINGFCQNLAGCFHDLTRQLVIFSGNSQFFEEKIQNFNVSHLIFSAFTVY